MLLHVVLARKGLVTLWTEGILLARMFLGMAGGMSRRGEEVAAREGLGQRARILVLLGRCLASA